MPELNQEPCKKCGTGKECVCQKAPSTAPSEILITPFDPMSHIGTPGVKHQNEWDQGWKDY